MIVSLIGGSCRRKGDVVSGDEASTMVRVGYAIPIQPDIEAAVVISNLRETATRRSTRKS